MSDSMVDKTRTDTGFDSGSDRLLETSFDSAPDTRSHSGLETDDSLTETHSAQPTQASQRSPSLGRNASVMFAGTLLSRITGLVRNLLFLRLGFSALSDAYNVANTTPNMVYELVAGGVLSAVLIPILSALERKNSQRARDGINAIVSLVAVTLIAAVIIVALAAPLIVWIWFHKPGDADKRELAGQLLRMFAPQIAMYGFVTLATASLNTRHRFGPPMFAPVLNNFTMISVLLIAQRMLDRLTKTASADDKRAGLRAVMNDTTLKYLFGFGTTAGVLAMALVLLPALRETGVRWRWRWEPRHPAVRELFRLSSWTLGYVAANLITLSYINWLLTKIDGDQTAYALAYSTFFLLPHGLFAVSIMTAIQPGLSRSFIERRRGEFRLELSRGIRTTMVVMVPAAVGYLVLSPSITALITNLIRSGKTFGPSQSRLLSDVLQAFVLGLPAFSVYLLLMNAFKAMRNTRATFIINVIECLINVVLAFVFYNLDLGVQGLALAFAAAYSIAVFIAGAHLKTKLRGIDGAHILDSSVRIGIAAGLMGLIVELTRRVIAALFIGSGALIRLPNLLGHLLEIGIASTLGLIAFVALARAVGVTELDALMRRLARRLPPRFRARPTS
jgi:putative peptidoglycan lipid II flippase